MAKIYGHGVEALVVDLVLALLGMAYSMVMYRSCKGAAKYGLGWWLGYALLTPNCCYAFLEVRHIVLFDNIADKLEPGALILFGGIGLIGLILTITCVLAGADLFRGSRLLGIVLFSTLQAFGASLGLLDVTSWAIMLEPGTIAQALYRMAVSGSRIMFFVWLSCFLSVVSVLFFRICTVHTRSGV